jgi:hypothetical protein
VEIRCSDQFICGSGSWLRIAKASVTLRDLSPPGIEATVSGQGLAGTVDVALRLHDEGGGIETAALRVDGVDQTPVQLGGSTCRRPFAIQTPCPRDGEAVLRLDKTGLSDGPHRVEAVVTDVAGNATVAGPFALGAHPTTPELPPSTSPVSSESAPVRAGRLSLQGRRTIRASYASPPAVRGTVKTAAGAGIAGAVVSVGTAQTVKTDAKGRFSVKLARGVSREVRFSYGDSVQTVKVIVAAPVRLTVDRKSTRNGRRVAFSGTVPGAGASRTLVELQARAGNRWVPFKTAALRDERFRATYRFTQTFSAQRYSFRAVIHDDPDFPYAAGRSGVVRVTVRP